MLRAYSSLLDKYLHQFNGSVFIVQMWVKSSAQSELYVVAGRLREGLAEPRRVVECAAGASGTTPLPVPQWVVLVVAVSRCTARSTVTEVVIANVWWDGTSEGLASLGARAKTVIIS